MRGVEAPVARASSSIQSLPAAPEPPARRRGDVQSQIGASVTAQAALAQQMHAGRMAWAVSPCRSGLSPLFQGGPALRLPPDRSASRSGRPDACGRPACSRCTDRGRPMNMQNDPTAGRYQIRHRPAGAAQRGPDAGARRRPLHRRRQPRRPGLCGDGAQPPSPTASSSKIDTDGGAQDEGRARRLHRRRPRRGYGTLKCIVPFKNRDGSRDEEAAAPGAGDRQGALRRRSDRLRGGRDAATRPRTPPKRSRSTSSRCRP